MFVKEIAFAGSFPTYASIPSSDLAEFCFWGRSNVGKSSFINTLCQRKNLAKVSSTPGKTQCFNQFVVDSKWQMVDLPGYGYAAVSSQRRALWDAEIRKYLRLRPNLFLCFILIDISIPPQSLDTAALEWLGKSKVPFSIIFTKADKLPKNQLSAAILSYEEKLSHKWAHLPTTFVTSSKSGMGVRNIRLYIKELLA